MESYLSKWASVAGLVRSFTATNSRFESLERRAQHIAAYPAKTVDANFNCHCFESPPEAENVELSFDAEPRKKGPDTRLKLIRLAEEVRDKQTRAGFARELMCQSGLRNLRAQIGYAYSKVPWDFYLVGMLRQSQRTAKIRPFTTRPRIASSAAFSFKCCLVGPNACCLVFLLGLSSRPHLRGPVVVWDAAR